MATEKIIIKGRVTDQKTKKGVAGLRVEAWDKDLIFNDLVGSAETGSDGKFEIQFDESYIKEIFPDRTPDLFFKVFLSGKLVESTEDSVVWDVKKSKTIIKIELTDY